MKIQNIINVLFERERLVFMVISHQVSRCLYFLLSVVIDPWQERGMYFIRRTGCLNNARLLRGQSTPLSQLQNIFRNMKSSSNITFNIFSSRLQDSAFLPLPSLFIACSTHIPSGAAVKMKRNVRKRSWRTF